MLCKEDRCHVICAGPGNGLDTCYVLFQCFGKVGSEDERLGKFDECG
jgi:hypothetical protein